MRTVRRVYLYLVAFISLEVVVWGLIGLTREAVDTSTLGGGVERLAMALALLLVGVPTFGVHWWLAQSLARRDEEERAASTRALFLYGVLIATLFPCVQNVLALLMRLLLTLTQLSPQLAWIGGRQNWSDNLIALAMNAPIAAYFWTVLQADWKAVSATRMFADMRRLSRYVWMLYGLILLIIGVQHLLRFALMLPHDALTYWPVLSGGVNGLALTLVGTAVWLYHWWIIQRSLGDEAEQQSLLRLALLYLLSLIGVSSVLVSGAIVLHTLLRILLGEATTLAAFLDKIATPLSVVVALSGMWGYYGNVLARTLKEVPDAPQRAAMRRLYFYILAAAGLTATLIGLNQLLQFTINALWTELSGPVSALRTDLAAALATLLVSLPLWGLTWFPMQREALRPGEAGDHARRSLIRKVYLYLTLLSGVIGGMVAAGTLLYNLLLAVLGQPPANLTLALLDNVRLLFLFALVGIYHGLALRGDGKLAAAALAEKHRAFPVLILDAEGGFAQALVTAIQRQAPALPLTIASPTSEVPPTSPIQAVILPADQTLTLPELWRQWLVEFPGYCLLVPYTRGKWLWSAGAYTSETLIQQTALILRHLAEGRPLRPRGISSAWLIGLSVLGILFLLQLLVGIVSAGLSLLFSH